MNEEKEKAEFEQSEVRENLLKSAAELSRLKK